MNKEQGSEVAPSVTLGQVVRHPLVWVLAAVIALALGVGGGLVVMSIVRGSGISAAAPVVAPFTDGEGQAHVSAPPPYEMKDTAYSENGSYYGGFGTQRFPGKFVRQFYSFQPGQTSEQYLSNVRKFVTDEYFAKLVDEKPLAPGQGGDAVAREVLLKSERVGGERNDEGEVTNLTLDVVFVETMKDGTQREIAGLVHLEMKDGMYRFRWDGELREQRENRVNADPVFEADSE